MPRMYNPDTGESEDVRGPEVKDRKRAGFITVGNRPASEYEGRSREELRDMDDDEGAEG